MDRAFEELEGLKSKLDDDKVARKVLAPALLLMQAEKLGVNETTLKYFGAVLWGAVGGDGYVSAAMKEVGLTSGKDSTALLWATAWAAYDVRPRAAGAGRVFHVIAFNDVAVRLAQLYALFGPPMLEEEGFIDPKLVEAVELGSKVSVEVVRVGETKKGNVVVTIRISAAGGGVWREFNVYLGEDVELSFASTNREEVELRANLLRLAGVETRVRKEGGRDVWYLGATTDQLAAGGEELRRELAKAVRQAREMGLLEEGKARRWIEKFEAGVSTWHGYKFTVGLKKSALRVELNYTRRENIEKTKEKLESLGLREGEHFTVTWLGEEKVGHLRLLKEGIIELAYVAKHGPEPQRLEAAELINHLRRRAEVKRAEVLEKLEELIRKGEEKGMARLVGRTFEVELEVGNRNVKAEAVIKEVKSWIEENEKEPGKSKLHIEIEAEISARNTAEKTPVTWRMTYFRRSKDNAVLGYTTTHADAPGGRDEYAKKIKTLVKAITDEEPAVNNKGGIDYTRRHLEGLKKYTELADVITKWLNKTQNKNA